MNSQEAVKKINSGMDNMSLVEMVEAYNALQGDTKHAGLASLLNGFARSKLKTYSSSKITTMELDEIGAFKDLIDIYGRDGKGNLTPEGVKAKEFADKVTQTSKDEKVEELVKAVQNPIENPTDGEKSGIKKPQDELGGKPKAEYKPTPLTPEQINILDNHGIMHNGTLESLGWFKDKNEVLKFLADEGHPAKQEVKAVLVEVEEEETVERPVNEAGLTGAHINKNMKELDELSNSINPLDEQDARFAESRNLMEILSDVRDNEDKSYDVRKELVELAKLQTERDLHDTKKVTQEDYIERLKFNMDTAVFAIVTGNEIDFSKYTGNQEALRANLKRSIDTYVKSAKDGKKAGNANIKLESVLGYMSTQSVNLNNFADGLNKKFGELPFVVNYKNKLQNFNQKCEKLVGPKVWGKVTATAKVLDKVAPDLAMAAVAGLGGPLGLAAFGAYTFQKRAMPFINSYFVQPKEKRTGFSQYISDNKKDATLAALYTASAGLSMGMAVFQGAASIASATSAATGQTLDVMAKAAATSQYASHARAAVSGATMLSKSTFNIYEAMQTGDSKEVNKNILRFAGSAAMFALGYGVRAWIGMENAESGNKTDATQDVVTENNVAPAMVDRDGDGISDTIDRDGGDGWANAPQLPVHDDFYHGVGVEAKSSESIIRLLTNSEVSRSEAILKAQMMVERIAGNENIQASFPSASDAQIAHAILLRASDVHKVDADELLRAFLGDGNCTKLTMEQQITEIHKGLNGYNYGQRTDLPYGRNLDPSYVGINTRSRFLLDDCESERLIDRTGERVATARATEEIVDPLKKTVITESVTENTIINGNTTNNITTQQEVVVTPPEEKVVTQPVQQEAPTNQTPPPAAARVLAENLEPLNGARDGVRDLNLKGLIQLKDAEGVKRWYVATPEEAKMLRDKWLDSNQH